MPSEIIDEKKRRSFLDPVDRKILNALQCSTTGEARRLIKNGGVSLDGKKITDHKENLVITKASILKVGKRCFIKLIPK